MKALRGLPTSGEKSGRDTTLLCLVGFMGAGKTSVGRIVARKLGWEFHDLDELIEELERQTISEIFSREGQKIFRNIETEALRRILDKMSGADCVLALGGGAIAQHENQELLAASGGTTAFLDGDPETLWRRCVDSPDSSPRPLLKDKASFLKLYAEREPVYRRADHTFSTDGKSVEKVAEEIATALGKARR